MSFHRTEARCPTEGLLLNLDRAERRRRVSHAPAIAGFALASLSRRVTLRTPRTILRADA